MDQPFGRLVGGSLSLDFVNTVRGRVRPSGTAPAGGWADVVVGERLDSYGALLRWGTQAGVLTAREAKRFARRAAAAPDEAAAVLRRICAVREAMYRIFKSAIERSPVRPSDLAVFNRECQVARAHERLTASPRLRWEWDDTPALDRVLWPVVQSAADLLTSPGLARVGQCPGDECGWLFLDTSRGRRRQWCDMAECGNLAKVRRFREKQRRVSGARRHRQAPQSL
jgi:predicted RNA-binding Zn ribbon-like protein